MKTTVSVTQAQASLPRLMRQLDRSGPVKITRRDEVSGFLVSRDFYESLVETLELASRPDFIAAVKRERSARPGRTYTLAELEALDED